MSKQAKTQSLADNAFQSLSEVLAKVAINQQVTMSIDKYLHISIHAGYDFHSAFCRIKDKKKVEARKVYPAIIIKAKDEEFIVLYKRADIKKAQEEIEEVSLSEVEKNFELISLTEKQIKKFKETKSGVISFRVTEGEYNEKKAQIMGDNGEPMMTMGEYAKLAFTQSYVIDRTASFVFELIEQTIYHQAKIGNNINQITKELHAQINAGNITTHQFDEAIKAILQLEQVLSDLLFKIEHLS